MRRQSFSLTLTALAVTCGLVGAVSFLFQYSTQSLPENRNVSPRPLVAKAPPVTVVFERIDSRGRVHKDVRAYDQNGNFVRESYYQPVVGAEPLLTRVVDSRETGKQHIYDERHRNRGTWPLNPTRRQQLMKRYRGEDSEADCQPAWSHDSFSFVAEPAINRIHGYRVVKVRSLGEAKAKPAINQPAVTFGFERWLAPDLGCAVLQYRSWHIDEVTGEASASTVTATSVAQAIDPAIFQLPTRPFPQGAGASDPMGD